MFFDPRPKEKREDLFDRERELERFSEALAYSPLILILGARRTGKTSLMNVALTESRQPCIMIDLRGLPYNPSRADLLHRFEAGFKRVSGGWRSSLLEGLNRVKGVSVLGSGISFSWGKNRVDLAELFDTVDEWASRAGVKFPVAFDELQIVRGEAGLPRLFAHVADANRNVVLVVSGSEVGVLFDFLGFDNPRSPLYGRHYSEITLDKLFEALKENGLAGEEDGPNGKKAILWDRFIRDEELRNMLGHTYRGLVRSVTTGQDPTAPHKQATRSVEPRQVEALIGFVVYLVKAVFESLEKEVGGQALNVST